MFQLHFAFNGFLVFYSVLALFLWIMTGLFSIQYFRGHEKVLRYLFFNLVTLFAVCGVFLAGDLLTLFLFFEIMSFASYAWVAQEETTEAVAASKTYLAIAVLGGLVMLMGIFMLWHAFGTLEISRLSDSAGWFMRPWRELVGEGNFGNRRVYLTLASSLIFFGFAAKAGVFPLHIWLPAAHPAAPAPASALLSGMLTKCGVFGMLLVGAFLMKGEEGFGTVIFFLGVVTMVLGALLGVLSVDLKRTLACSSVSQIGFITVGVGLFVLTGGENANALYGTVYHMVNHSLLKLVLFMAAGVVYIHTHSLQLNDIRGFGRKHPVLGAVFALGGLGLAGVPGMNGYLSKTLLHEAIVEYAEEMEKAGEFSRVSLLHGAEIAFLIAGGLTLAYMLKLFAAVFLEKGAGERHEVKRCMTVPSGIAILGSAALLPVLGLTPNLIFARIGEAAARFFTGTATGDESGISAMLQVQNRIGLSGMWLSLENLRGSLISVCIGILVYFGFVRTCLMKKEQGKTVYANRLPVWMDMEKVVYRPVFLVFLPFLCAFFCRICDIFTDSFTALLKNTVFSPGKHKMSIWVGTKLTHMLGTFMDKIIAVLNKLVFRKNPIKKSFVSVFAVGELEAKQTFALITGSVSFGLLLAAAGLVVTLLYLLF